MTLRANPLAISSRIKDEIQFLMLPWRVGKIQVWMAYDIDFDVYKVAANLGLFPDDVYSGVIYRQALVDMIDPANADLFVATMIANHFLSISAPIGDNIVLGEN